MAEDWRNSSSIDLRKTNNEPLDDKEQTVYKEETSAEIANPMPIKRETNREKDTKATSGIGLLALIFAVLSLFFSPLLFGIIGIVLGIAARKKESGLGLSSWAIGISVISIVLSLFFT